MNIYKLENFTVTGYDTYDSCIVVANSEEEACKIHPDYIDAVWSESNQTWLNDGWHMSSTWCKPSDVVVKLIGVTDLYDKPTVILSSFNAG